MDHVSDSPFSPHFWCRAYAFGHTEHASVMFAQRPCQVSSVHLYIHFATVSFCSCVLFQELSMLEFLLGKRFPSHLIYPEVEVHILV